MDFIVTRASEHLLHTLILIVLMSSYCTHFGAFTWALFGMSVPTAAVAPASTGKIKPVTHLDSSEASHLTAAPTLKQISRNTNVSNEELTPNRYLPSS